MANKPGEANFFPDVPAYPEMGTFMPVYGKFDLTTYIQGASDYEIMAFLVGKYNACLEAYGTVTKLSTDTVTACKQLQDWINSWFDNLDVQEELNKKIDSMVQDGSFATLLHQTFDAQINQQAANTTTAWLVANVTPAGSAVVVDKSLSIEGAAADAMTTGSTFTAVNDRNPVNYNVDENTGIFISSGHKGQSQTTNTIEPITLNPNECIIVTASVPDSLMAIGALIDYKYVEVGTKINNTTYYYKATTKTEISCSYNKTSPFSIFKSVFTHNATLNALDFGFKNDNVTDNSDVMDNFLKIANTTPIVFPSGKYVFSRAINFPDNFYVTLDSSKFITNDDFSDDYFITFRKDSTASDYTDGSYFKGGELYCNYQCKIAAIGCYKTRNTIISDVIIHDCNIGIQTRTADTPDGNIKMQHCAIINSVAKAGTTAINDNAFDCVFDDITIVNFETAIYTIAGRFNQIRAWFNSGAAIGNSCFAIVDGNDISFSNIAIDTYRYGFKVIATNGGACVSNVLVIRNPDIYPDSIINIEPPFLVLHGTINPLLLMCNVSIPNDYKYKLFSEDNDANTCKLINYRLGTIAY